MTEFTTWRSLVDGAEISAIPDSVVSRYVPKEQPLGTITTVEDSEDFSNLSGSAEIVDNGINNNQSFRLNGSELLQHNTTYGDSTNHFAVVFPYQIQEAVNSNNFLVDGGSLLEFAVQDDDGGEFQLYINSNIDDNTGYVPDGNPHIARLEVDENDNVTFAIDGVAQSTPTLNQNGLSGLTLASRADDTLKLQADYGEVLVLVNPESGDVSDTEDRLAQEFDIA